jgi:hypothetical protein
MISREDVMDLEKYFESKKGLGVFSTADAEGKVNAAVYGTPHFLEKGLVSFIMADRLSHANLQSNPNAIYLFKEDGEEYQGKRLYLTKVKESEDQELIKPLMRRQKCSCLCDESKQGKYFLVSFKVDRELPLIGE